MSIEHHHHDHEASHDQHDHGTVPPDPGKAIDPVCGMTVDRETAEHRTEHAGEIYYFCCAGCRSKFEARPDVFLDEAPREAIQGR